MKPGYFAFAPAASTITFCKRKNEKISTEEEDQLVEVAVDIDRSVYWEKLKSLTAYACDALDDGARALST